MITTEIYLEGRRLDITQDVDAFLTYAIDDIKDFSSRNTTFSKTIVLPGTAQNNLLFGHIFNVSTSNFYDPDLTNVGVNFNAAKGAKCIILRNHIQVFKGVLRLLEVVISSGVPEYEVAVFGELGGLVLKLGSKKLQDLDFSAYDVALNASGITDTWPNYNSGQGVFFPLIDYGDVSTNKVDYDLTAFRPALFIREYLDKIFTAAGYTWQSDLLDSDRFKRLIVPHNKKELTYSGTNILTASTDGDLILLDSGPSAIRFPWHSSSGTLFTKDNPAPDTTRFTYNGVDPININVQFNITYTYQTDGTFMTLELKKNGTTVASKLLLDTGSVTTPGKWIEDVPLSFITNDYIEIWVTVGNSLIVPYVFTLRLALLDVISTSPLQIPVALGDTVVINDSIPYNVLQKDFLSSIIKLFNLYVYEDIYSDKKLFIDPYVDFYDLNVSGIRDWTMKMDRVRERRIRPMSEINSKVYEFKYKDDSDYYNNLYKKRYNETYGSRIYNSEFEFESDSTKIELIFSPTPLVGYAGLDKVVSTIFKLTNSVEEKIDSNIRILQAFNVTGVTSWAIKDGAATVQSGLTNYGYAGHFDDPDNIANDLNFGATQELFFTVGSGTINVNQFNVYWSPYMAEITDKDSKLLVASFKLTTKDIHDLDFSKFIYLDGSYWRLNRIVDWNAAYPDVCIVELLKVIYTTY